MSRTSMALDGIRVLDWTNWIQGAVATSILGGLGAEVIKIEEPRSGDPARGFTHAFGIPIALPTGTPATFESHNRNKKGVTLNLKNPKGREIMYSLVEKSDILVHSWRTRVVKKLGMDYETLRQYNEKLIYGRATAYGPNGPIAERGAFDYTAQAASGMMLLMRESEDAEPVLPVSSIADDSAAVCLALGLITALLVRERTGVGQVVTSSLLGSMMSLLRTPLNLNLLLGKSFPRVLRQEAQNPLVNYYRCKDGKWIAFAVHMDKHWALFCNTLDLPQLEKHPKFNNASKRRKNNKQLISILDHEFAKKTCNEWEQILSQVPDLVYSPVNSLQDLPSDPQVIENRYITEFDDPVLGTTKVVSLPVHFSKTPWALRLPSPKLGQHTEEVLTEVLGYSWQDIEKLRYEGVF